MSGQNKKATKIKQRNTNLLRKKKHQKKPTHTNIISLYNLDMYYGLHDYALFVRSFHTQNL